MQYKHFLLDWGNTLMQVGSNNTGPMHCWKEVFAVPNAEDLLVYLTSIGECHIASNAADSDADEVRLALKRVNLDRFITYIFTAKSLGFTKTDSRYYPHIIQTLKAEYTQVIMIGDNKKEDVIAAKQAGIDAIWLNADEKTNDNMPITFNSLLAIRLYLSQL